MPDNEINNRGEDLELRADINREDEANGFVEQQEHLHRQQLLRAERELNELRDTIRNAEVDPNDIVEERIPIGLNADGTVQWTTIGRRRRRNPIAIRRFVTGNAGTAGIDLGEERIEKDYYAGLENDMKKINDDGTVTLFEERKNIPQAEAVYVNRIQGWFPKNHPDLHQDAITKDRYFIINKKYDDYYKGMLKIVYTGINDKGNLINPKYTDYPQPQFYYPQTNAYNVYGAQSFIDMSLLNNETFRKFYKESLFSGAFYHVNDFNKEEERKHPKAQYRKCRSNYRSEGDGKPTTYIKTHGKKYSFGLEIETSSGYLPPYLDNLLDYSAVHDGSLRDEEGHTYGGEYVTGVLRGDKGLLQLKMLCNELSKRCMVNHRCGVHTHIGDVNFTKETIVLMYYLYSRLENEIFAMLPKSRRKNEYCRKLKPVNIDLDNIIKNYNMSVDAYYNDVIAILAQTNGVDRKVNKKKDHPKGHKCNYDHSTARYCWVNFIPAVFDTRKGSGVYTIEFRPHSATTSYIKIKNWLLICMALVDIVVNHKGAIYNNPNISLNEIIMTVYPKEGKKLLDYIEKRVNKFSSKEGEEIDYTDNEVDETITIKNL